MTRVFICILDFEATCNEKGTMPNEIIEFPSVMYEWNLNTNEFKKLSEFQEYCHPLHNPKLTKFCTDLTGITQDKIDSARLLLPVWKSHYKWVCDTIGKEQLDDMFFVTCGRFDFEVMLKKDVARHKISRFEIPLIYKRYINIKTIFKQTLKLKYGMGLANMMNHLSLTMDGRHHSGIDDCRNTGKLFGELIKKGYKFDRRNVINVWY